MNLRQVAEALRANAHAVHVGTITWDAFSSENNRLWRIADMNQPCIIGSRASRRCAMVHKYLNQMPAAQ